MAAMIEYVSEMHRTVNKITSMERYRTVPVLLLRNAVFNYINT